MMRKRSARFALLACGGIVSLGLLAGAAPAAAKSKGKAVTKTATVAQCTGTAVPIPDGDDVSNGNVQPVSTVVPFSVPKFRGKPQDGLVTTVNSVGVRITHTYVSDLYLLLVSPGGKVINLTADEDSTGDGYGSGSADCNGGLVQFGDSFPIPITDVDTDGENPITGSYKPRQPLATLAGGPARGNWTLVVWDSSNEDVGTINAFSVNLTYTYRAVKKTKKGRK